MAREESAGDRVRDRDGYDQFCAAGSAGDQRGFVGEVAGTGAAADGGVRGAGPSEILPGECGRVERAGAGGSVRLDLFVWGDSSYPASGAGAGAGAAVRAAGNNGEDHGVPPKVVEGAGDFAG